MGSQTDKFGIPMWKASKPGGFFYESSDDPTSDDAFEGGNETKTTGTNEVTMSPNGPTNFHLGKNVKGFKDSTGGCALHFPDAAGRGYAWKQDDVRDMEIKGVFKFNIGSNGFSISVCTGHHTTPKPCCQGHAYMITIEPSQSPYGALFRKEMWHVSYHPSPEGSFDIPGMSGSGWVGLGLVRYNKKVSDDPTEDQVVLELWANVHPDSDIKDWKMIKSIIDKKGNGWGNDGDVKPCNGDKDQVLTWSGPKNRFKTNASSGTVKAKMLSLREIDPLGTVDPGGGGTPGGGGLPPEPPPPPTTGTIFRDWNIVYNIITFPDDACQSGTDLGTLTPFYVVTDNGSSSNLHRDRYRVGMVANGSASKFIGKKPRRVKMMLSSTGSPPAGEITVVMRKNNTDEVAATFTLTAIDGVVTAPPLNATMLSSTKKQYTFESLASEYVWQVGDRLMVEYSSNTVDTTNDINVFRSTDNPYDGTNSCAIKFDAGGPPPTGYSEPDTDRDYAWEISEVSSAVE
jgi:hypothetical protein